MATPGMAMLSPLDALAKSIRQFVRDCRQPQLLESGEPAIGLVSDGAVNWQVQSSGGWLILEAWNNDTFLSRKIRGIKSLTRERMELTTERFGGKPGVLVLYDAFRPSNAGIAQKGRRLVFAQGFRHFLEREFPGARIERLHTDADLENSLSPAYPRALIKYQGAHLAAIAAPPRSDVDGVLSFGLIWLDYLRRAGRGLHVGGLVLFVPHGREQTTCLRLQCLDPQVACYRLFAFDEADCTVAVDLTDCGNLDTHLPATPGEDRAPRLLPEAMIEEQIRSQLETLDAHLRPDPVYGQVPNFSGPDRGILDLLAIDYTGRLAVIELKATESVHLPLQALDYWLRVKWHLERNDFSRYGYFPGLAIRRDAPRLLLAAPALRYHPTNERILGYFRRVIEVQRIGLAEGPGPIRVMFRY
ncbi:MAG: hypothetical protein HY820_17640 [Acidobacteria bacterium]|nr:hypothetical protein [Acidobacteriota bacterium]